MTSDKDGRPRVKYDNVPSNHFNKAIRDYMAAAASAVTGEPGSWTARPEVPSPREILAIDDDEADTEEGFDLLANRINGPWPSTEVYLKTHYDLLREDAVAPLRDAVAYVRHNPRMKDTQDVCIYEKVHIVGLTCAAGGIAARIQFSTARAGKNIVWEYSKRLISGNVVALTPADDGFQSTCVVAIVAARPLESLKTQPPEIDIFFARPEDADFDTQLEWLMVEAKTGYYEATRHSMTALQKMATETFPLSEYLCHLNSDIDSPDYVKADPIVDMSPVYGEDSTVGQVDILANWPSAPETLDKSQWDALRQILTKKLSIIQGPPGTGKTHVSVMALKILLSNLQHRREPPIIIAAQTNHALDQLLRHVAGFEREYVRVGGRSADLEIKKHTLFELGRNCVVRAGGTLSGARKQMGNITQKIVDVIAPFKLENASHPLPASLFFKLGLITQTQHDSLIKGAEGWVHDGDQADPVSAWLGEAAVKFEVVYKTENFGFVEEEIDMEYEQLKELEAEQGLDDDGDYESLKGAYISLKEGFTARRHHTFSDKNADDKYLRCQDMWKIPTVARGAVYSLLQKRAKEIIRDKLRTLVEEYKALTVKAQAGKWEKQCIVLQNAKIVGMTTTGLSKYRGLISSLNPKIILIEEAAEVIEAPVAAACLNSLEHLILVGDHQQLQGHCAVSELEGEPFYLNISLFERLVHNRMGFKRLSKQRRMIPEIRQVVNPIYNNLQDHPSVLDRPGVPGMGDVSSYFFCHTWQESSDSLMSRYNADEAKMVVGFYLYLCMNGVKADHITVLTFYNGQRKKILKALKESPLLQGQYVRVVTVDSYQGEENEIVLLSLVRSNTLGNIGFLSIENRVCVALSRARRGLYIFGDAEALSVINALWWEVVQIMRKSPKRLGYILPLTCSRHNARTWVRNPETFSQLDGGCMAKCGEKLPCGHQCPLRCHAMGHSQVRCLLPCTRSLPCGHKCSEPCFQDCKCSCEGEASAHAQPAQKRPEQATGKRPLTPSYQRKFISKEEHTAFVQSYKEYANGGAKREDIRLTAMAHQQVEQEELQRADEESFEALFGNVKISTPAASKDASSARAPVLAHGVVREGPVKEVTDAAAALGGTPPRRKYTQFYSSGGHARTGSNGNAVKGSRGAKSKETNLLDTF